MAHRRSCRNRSHLLKENFKLECYNDRLIIVFRNNKKVIAEIWGGDKQEVKTWEQFFAFLNNNND